MDQLTEALNREVSQQTFVLIKTSWRRLSSSSSEDVFKTSWSWPIYSPCPYVFKTSSRRFQDVFKTSSKHLKDVLPRRLQDVFKTSSKLLANTSWKHLQDVLKTYHQVKLLLLTSLWEVFNMFVRRTAKTFVYRKIHLGQTSEKFMISVQNLQGWS